MALIIGKATEIEIDTMRIFGFTVYDPPPIAVLEAVLDPNVYGAPENEPGDEPRRIIMVDTDMSVSEIAEELG